MRMIKSVRVLFVAMLAFAALWPLFPSAAGSVPGLASANRANAPEWAEAAWVPHNTAPRRLPLSAREQRFSRQFPGQIARFADERHEWIVRVMDKPTRMLHPAADCFRGLGYVVTPPRVRLDAGGEQWRCFTASGKGRTLTVCERIFDAHGGRWTEASSWYWTALLAGEQHADGPWWAVTKVEAAE